MRTKLAALSIVSALAAAGATSAFAHTGGKTLTGTVGPDDTITLTSGGHKVTSLARGSYTFVIQDKANDHNFHLTGPGVDKRTSVGGTGQATWHVTLGKGTYRYVCDPHASYMKGSIAVS